MTLDSINRWLTLAANLGVLAGIVFLGFEIRQNSEALLASSRQDLLEADLGVLKNLMDHPSIVDPARSESLSPDDARRREVYYISLLRVREFAWQQYQNGLLDESTFSSYMEPLKGIFNSDVGREYLLNRGYSGDSEFTEYLIEYLQLRD